MPLATTSSLLALLLACAWSPLASAALPPLPCATATKVAGCSECQKTPARCYFCTYQTSPVWNSSSILTKCKTTSTSCASAGPKDVNCARCDGALCIRCKQSYGLTALGKCASVSTLATCRAASLNNACGACNPDGTCSRCSDATKVLIPINAIYLDAGYPETQCSTLTQAKSDALDITGSAPTIPASCAELDTDFKCAACTVGRGPVPTSATSLVVKSCNLNVSGRYPSKCLTTLPWMKYCLACSTDGKTCLRCTSGRSVDGAGQCSLNCKGYFGVYCGKCTASSCTALDPAWKLMRRRRM